MNDPRLSRFELTRIRDGVRERHHDQIAVEEPLEIRLWWTADGSPKEQSISITMRTPGDDAKLATGFLFTESIIRSTADIESVAHCATRNGGAGNVIRVRLAPGARFDPGRLTRHFYTSSSCGVCGKASIEALNAQPRFEIQADEPRVCADVLAHLPSLLDRAQDVFHSTGGLHAAALFDHRGELISLREDVGRHNALDKVIGEALGKGNLPLSRHIVLLSGRAGFELVQKSVMAGIPIVAAIGAPSSLALELARSSGITLVGFLRHDRMNVYTGDSRIVHQS